MPAHQLKPLHPKWSTADPKPTYQDFANALPPDKLPLVTMGPWVITEYKTDELMIMRRNPYYWKVDEAGNQLPYFDEIQYRKGTSGIGRRSLHHRGRLRPHEPGKPEQLRPSHDHGAGPDAKYAITWGPELLGYAVMFNLSKDLGVQGDRDTAVRDLFRDLRFRKAMATQPTAKALHNPS